MAFLDRPSVVQNDSGVVPLLIISPAPSEPVAGCREISISKEKLITEKRRYSFQRSYLWLLLSTIPNSFKDTEVTSETLGNQQRKQDRPRFSTELMQLSYLEVTGLGAHIKTQNEDGDRKL